VSQGDLLFEISPLDDYRIDLKIKENRIADIQIGQTGLLYLSAIPEKPYDFKIIRITPTTVPEDKQTFFMVEAELIEFDKELQIGMEGIAQVEIDERKLISIWSRDFVDWLRLKFWSLSN
ncbi:MAG: HlyD family secretion protein, partial [Gammaproteobacteria bacterium]|nr:HlyD family secretion protein [Gammaproteobacteria bacterium]